MSHESRSARAQDILSIQLHSSHLPVSYVSSLLRVVQAAIREVAMSDEATRQEFDRRPQPRLLLAGVASPLEGLSSRAFAAFLHRFEEFVKTLPQPGLWGGGARRRTQSSDDSASTRRMDQVYLELRRSPKVTIRFRDRLIEIEGDRMEIA